MTSLLSIMPAEGARSTPATRTRFTKHSNKVAKHHELLHAKNYSFVPVVTDTSGALHSASLRLLYDFASSGAAPYATSLLTGSRARPRRGVQARWYVSRMRLFVPLSSKLALSLGSTYSGVL